MTLLKNHTINLGHKTNLIKLHCVIHKEALCASSTNLQSVMNITVKVVNAILSKQMYHRLFCQILLEAESQYGDLIFFFEFRWLSRGSMLARVYKLRNEFSSFQKNKNINNTVFQDAEWLLSFAFLVDLTSQLNKLNLQLLEKINLFLRCGIMF